MKKSILYIVVITLIISSCTEDNSTVEIPQNVIVEGYLHLNEPINTFKLMSVIPYYDSLNNQNIITDAVVNLGVDGNNYTMTSLENGYYELPNITVEAGKIYTINLDYYGESLAAETTIPALIEGLTISDTLIELTRVVASNGPPTGGNGNFNIAPLEITWTEDEAHYYYVSIKNTETDIDWIDERRIPDEETLYSFSSEPDIINLYSIDVGRQLTQFGRHEVIVYKVNPEYALMLSQQSDDSFSLSEPYSNITNGKGIFTGISSDTTYFEVVPD